MEQRMSAAVKAMNEIGIAPQLTRSVLKSLLNAYDHNWEYIEEENYRLLADAIFESQASMGAELKTKKDNVDGPDNDGGTDLEIDVKGSEKKNPRKTIVSKCSVPIRIPDKSSSNFRVASSSLGDVVLSLKCSSGVLDSPDFHVPNMEDICNLVENRCLASVKTSQPNFSLIKILKEICDCYLELGSQSRKGKAKMAPEKYIVLRADGNNGDGNGKREMKLSKKTIDRRVGENNGDGISKKKLKLGVSEASNALVVFQPPQIAVDDVKRLVNPRDITNGQERYRVPLVNEVNNDIPSFHYIPHNIIYQNAKVPVSLARIGDESCCSDCYGDCLRASVPCECARETGGEYAYTSDGLLKEEFLDYYVAQYQNPQEHHLHYCQNCPIEKIKNADEPEQCKGHKIGTFIKECWAKCGCHRQCGNRVVQRGIRCHLEVFYTGKKKGWGLCSTEELPKGTFICEYVGEILTNMELYERTMHSTMNEKHTYPVMLDADWASEGILEDEESLCLDATNYGNVARFMNHRCFDGNLMYIPVEIETPDHHYYHVAFFTTRKVEPYEELTWDYGLDFDDKSHPVKAFKCLCRSKLCRDRN